MDNEYNPKCKTEDWFGLNGRTFDPGSHEIPDEMRRGVGFEGPFGGVREGDTAVHERARGRVRGTGGNWLRRAIRCPGDRASVDQMPENESDISEKEKELLLRST